MSLTESVIQGTLQPDGTLVLDEKPNLPAGRVTVMLRQVVGPQPLNDAFWQMMEGIWAAQKARGHVPRSVEEVEVERRRMREESEQEILEALRLQDESRLLQQQTENR